jgi:hypothetical protein
MVVMGATASPATAPFVGARAQILYTSCSHWTPEPTGRLTKAGATTRLLDNRLKVCATWGYKPYVLSAPLQGVLACLLLYL